MAVFFSLKKHFSSESLFADDLRVPWVSKLRQLKQRKIDFSRNNTGLSHKLQDEYTWLTSMEGTPLTEYWLTRLCSLERHFSQLFESLRLPEESAVPTCRSVSALRILAAYLSEATFLIRRRSLTATLVQIQNIRKLRSVFRKSEIPVLYRSINSQMSGAFYDETVVSEEEFDSMQSKRNEFMHLKSLTTTPHVKVRSGSRRSKLTTCINKRCGLLH